MTKETVVFETSVIMTVIKVRLSRKGLNITLKTSLAQTITKSVCTNEVMNIVT